MSLKDENKYLLLENKMLKARLEHLTKEPDHITFDGCGDGSCEIQKPSGMHTNSGCRCSLRKFKLALGWYKRYVAFVQHEIDLLRNEKSQLKDQKLLLLNVVGNFVNNDHKKFAEALKEVGCSEEITKAILEDE